MTATFKLRAEGFTDGRIEVLRALTKREDEKGTEEGYMRFIRRAATNPVARTVKRADLQDNMVLSRLAQPTEEDRQRVRKYAKAMALLEGARG